MRQLAGLGLGQRLFGLAVRQPGHHAGDDGHHPHGDGDAAAKADGPGGGLGVAGRLFGLGLVGGGAPGGLFLLACLGLQDLDVRLLGRPAQGLLCRQQAIDLGLAFAQVVLDKLVGAGPCIAIGPGRRMAMPADARLPARCTRGVVGIQPATALQPALGALLPFKQFTHVLRFVIEPALQLAPAADQAFMADVDQVSVLQRAAGRRQHEARAGCAVGVDHRHQVGLGVGAHQGPQLGQGLRPAHVTAVAALDQGQEALPGHGLLRRRQGVVDLRGVVVDGQGQGGRADAVARAADGQVVLGFDAAAPGGLGAVPHAQQGMLEHGQLVLTAEGVDQAVGQHRGYRPAHQRQRRGDDRPDLLGAQARCQVDAAVDGLGQAVDGHRMAQKIRAHRHHNIDRHVLAGRSQQQLDETVGLVRVALAVAKDLLELVHHQQQRLALELRGVLAVQRAQRQGRRTEQRGERGVGQRAVDTAEPARVAGQRMGQPGQRGVAGGEDAGVPAVDGGRCRCIGGLRQQGAAAQGRDQAGPRQRRFAGARRTQHGQETLAPLQLFKQIAHMRVAAKEQQRLALEKGPQPDIRRWQRELDALQRPIPCRNSTSPCSLTSTRPSASKPNSLATVPDCRNTPHSSIATLPSATWLR